MPTYEYECEKCGRRFELRQAITEDPITTCRECQGIVHRLISGGVGFIFKGFGHGRASRRGGECSLEPVGKTCCGREERCDKPPCEGKS
jgi:putative FmdB family regulatory protein